jgi:hypothetical protein
MIYWIVVIGLAAWFWRANRGRFKLNTWSFNNEVDETLDMILSGCISSGISSVKCNSKSLYSLEVCFNNGKKLVAWNENKYYAWLHMGTIGEYSWTSGRPRTETMVRLLEEIKKYYIYDNI